MFDMRKEVKNKNNQIHKIKTNKNKSKKNALSSLYIESQKERKKKRKRTVPDANGEFTTTTIKPVLTKRPINVFNCCCAAAAVFDLCLSKFTM